MESAEIYRYILTLLLTAYLSRLGGAAACSDCTNILLRRESKSITYATGDEHNCNCQWTIPTSMDTDDNTAVVLLLQNVSLPITSGSSGSIDCSAGIRFPGTNGYKCNFRHNYCLAFATKSTNCNITKINESIPVSNHTCDSLIPWSKAGGSPYKILYNAGNFAGYTKYFMIQYLVIDCRTISTMRASTSVEDIEAIKNVQNKDHTTTSKPGANKNNTATVIIIVIAVVLLLAVMIGATFFTIRRKKTGSSDMEENPTISQDLENTGKSFNTEAAKSENEQGYDTLGDRDAYEVNDADTIQDECPDIYTAVNKQRNN